jgi:hypothetical protein
MHTKHLILALSAAITLASLGTLVFAQTASNQPLVIPTTPADHNAFLNTLILCVENSNCTDATAQQTITFTNAETTGDLLLVFPERLIAGDGSSNTIETGADYAVIA